MKKVIAILAVLVMVAGFAFAVNDTLTMQLSSKEIKPAFKIHYGTADDERTTIVLSDSISDKAIAANFVIAQEGEMDGQTSVAYSRYGSKSEQSGTPVELTVTCSEFYYYGVNGSSSKDANTKSGAPTLSAAANGNTIDGKLTYVANFPSVSGTTVTFKPTYHGKKVADQVVGTFTATWPQDTAGNLPYGVYKADVTLTYGAL